MSIGCKCDRCGEFYVPNQDEVVVPISHSIDVFNKINLVRYEITTDKTWRTSFNRMDVCPKCAHSFNLWWTEPESEQK